MTTRVSRVSSKQCRVEDFDSTRLDQAVASFERTLAMMPGYGREFAANARVASGFTALALGDLETARAA